MVRKIIIAHRGYHTQVQENTIEAFEKAIEIGADMIEFDVRKTRDNILISYHDQFINSQAINKLTYQQLNAIASLAGFDIPTVDQVIEFTKNRIKLVVELKENGYEKQIAQLLLENLNPEQFIIISFKFQALKKIKNNYPQVRVGLLLSRESSRTIIFLIRFLGLGLLEFLIGLKPDILLPNFNLLKSGLIKIKSREPKPVFVWTVNEEKHLQEFLNSTDIQAIITDKSDLATMLQR